MAHARPERSERREEAGAALIVSPPSAVEETELLVAIVMKPAAGPADRLDGENGEDAGGERL